jgi:hypothetical protein
MSDPILVSGLLTGGLVVIGSFLKSVPKFPNPWIPSTLIILGTLIHMWMTGFNPVNLLVGIQISAAATGLHQVWKQHTEEPEKP